MILVTYADYKTDRPQTLTDTNKQIITVWQSIHYTFCLWLHNTTCR